MANWEPRVQTISGALAAVGVPLAIAYLANAYTATSAERGVQAKLGELSVSILTREPTPQDSSLREWAVDILNKFSTRFPRPPPCLKPALAILVLVCHMTVVRRTHRENMQ